MHRSVCATLILAALGASTVAHPEMRHPAVNPPGAIDLALTYATDRARLAPGNCGCFWLRGGSADAALTVWKGLGVAGSIGGDRIANYAPGTDFNKVTYLGGPRYTWTMHRLNAVAPAAPHLQFFGEGLFGVVRAFNGTFPLGSGVTASASSFALQTGGGVNLVLAHHVGFRLVQAEYVRTRLPNGFANTQNDLRLSAGLKFSFGSTRNTR